jgi:hypothetical protein
MDVVKPVAVVDNDVMPGPRHSLRHRLLPSLLSRFLAATAGVSATQRPLLLPLMRLLLPPLIQSPFPWLLPLPAVMVMTCCSAKVYFSQHST